MKVKLTRTIVFGGRMYMRGSEINLPEKQLSAINGKFEVLDQPKPARKARATVIAQSPANTVMEAPAEAKKSSKKRSRKRSKK